MKRRVKLTITNLTNEDAGALVGLIPDTASYKLETEDNGHNRRSSRRAYKKGTTIKLLKHMVVNGQINRDRATKMLENLGAKNGSAQISAAIARGFMTENTNHALRLTAEGRAKAQEETKA
jgi:hypothetical protein